MKIVSYIPNPDDATSLYRGQGPMCQMHKINKRVDVVAEKFGNMQYLIGYDAAFFQRPATDKFSRTIQEAKFLNNPIVIDYDDDLLNVPTNNKFIYDNKAVGIDWEKETKTALECADTVCVTTDHLKKRYSEYNDNITVIPNAWNDYTMPMAPEFNYNKVIVWRGGTSHVSDMHVHKEKYAKLIKENKDFKFVFIGDPEIINWAGDFRNVEIIKLMPVSAFFTALRHIKPGMILTPLKDYDFNYGKSNIAKIEATVMGGLCLAPDWDEWRWGAEGEHLYSNPAEFYDEAMDMIDKIRTKDKSLEIEWDHNVSHVQNNLALSKVNEERIAMFDEVINRHREYDFDLKYIKGVTK